MDNGAHTDALTSADAAHTRAMRLSRALWLTAFYAAVLLPVLLGPIGPASFAATLLLGAGLIALSVIDLETMRLPDSLTLPLAGAGLALAYGLGWEPPVLFRLAAAMAGFGFVWIVAQTYQAVRGRSGIGLGDGKLLAVAGAWAGPDGLPATLLYACAAALLFAAVRALCGKALKRDEPFPFGPFLAAGLWLVWCYGSFL